MWRIFLPLVLMISAHKKKIPPKVTKTVIKKLDVETKSNQCTVVDEVEVTGAVIQSKGEVFEVDLHIPVVSGIKNSTLQNRINNHFESDALSFKNETEVYVKEYVKEAEKKHIPINPCIAKTEYKVHYNKNNILSISVTYYSYTGGVHGSTVIKTMNINVNTGKTLPIREFFESGKDYEETILTEIHREIEENKDKYYADAIEKLKVIPANQPFYIEEGNIVIYFDQYEIAPYASGIPEFKIPVSVMPC